MNRYPGDFNRGSSFRPRGNNRFQRPPYGRGSNGNYENNSTNYNTYRPRFQTRGGKFNNETRGRGNSNFNNVPRGRGNFNNASRGRGAMNAPSTSNDSKNVPTKCETSEAEGNASVTPLKEDKSNNGGHNYDEQNAVADSGGDMSGGQFENEVGQFGFSTTSATVKPEGLGQFDLPVQRNKTTPSTSQQQPSEDQEEDDSDSDEDTGFCKYCKLDFASDKAYHAHTRGIQHTSLVMQAKSAKGNVHYKKEVVAPEVLEVNIPAPYEPKPELKEEEYDVEENWMNLDSSALHLIKDRKNLDDRDLTPDMIGKKQFSEDFTCPLCHVKCTGATSFKMHIEGKQHKGNLNLAEQGVKLKKKKVAGPGLVMESTGRETKFKEMTAHNPSPMLGLEFITEFQKPDFKAAPRYVCNLCESKCDTATIVPHIVGVKHRLNYFKQRKPKMFDHLTRYNSKKKKSEMNANCEDFARQVEEEIGRSEVKAKIELDSVESEEELHETMKRQSMALREMVELKRLPEPYFENVEPIPKKPRPGPEPRERGRGRGRGMVHEYHSPYPGYDRRFPRPRGDFREDFRDAYRERYDPYRPPYEDPYYERRMREERHHLEDLYSKEHHRLVDPMLEQRRLADILARREDLDRLERSRLDDIMQRKKQLVEENVDYQRLKRYERFVERRPDIADRYAAAAGVDGRELTISSTAGSSIGEAVKTSSDYRPSMEELIANRRRNMDYAVKVEERPVVDQYLLQDRSQQHTLADVDTAARNKEAAKVLTEEASKNPHLNVVELFSNLSSSMIASEDDAAMALQVSNALTQALLKYRLQNAPEELSSFAESLHPVMETKQEIQEQFIPGLGISSTQSNVPSFLKTPQENAVVAATEMPHPDVSQAVNAAQKTLVATSSIEQPQRVLLESIRKQTELLKQKIAETTKSINNNETLQPSSQNQSMHTSQSYSNYLQSPSQSSGRDKITAQNHLSYQEASTGQTTPQSSIRHIERSPYLGTPGTPTSTATSDISSEYHSQWYQYNFQMMPPNSTPQSVSSPYGEPAVHSLPPLPPAEQNPPLPPLP